MLAQALGFEYTCGLRLSDAKVECYGISITMTREYESIAGVSSGSDVYKHTDALWKVAAAESSLIHLSS